MRRTRGIDIRSAAYRLAMKHDVFVPNDRGGRATQEHPDPPVSEKLDLPISPYDEKRFENAKDVMRLLGGISGLSLTIGSTIAPELNILLDLFICEHRRRPVTVSDACGAAGVPFSSGLRAIAKLAEADLIARSRDPRDMRRRLLSLSDLGRTSMARFLDDWGRAR